MTKLERPERLDTDKLEALKELFPQVFSDGKINFEALREELADEVEELAPGDEHYGLSWPGKREAKRLASKGPTGTLRPVPGAGVNEDITKNMIIEGDNLEVLRIMQKAYAGRIKMIYIDPPYNTGKDFIYRDDFREPVEAYLESSGQSDEQGLLVANAKLSGRFHSNWLTMLYPRLRLARSLLQSDGVICVSIDDNEANNLKSIMDEIFGEENYLSSFYIQVRYAGKTLVEDMDFQKLIETVFIYGKGPEAQLNKPESEYSFDKFVWEVIEIGIPKTVELGGKKVEIFASGSYEIRKVEAGLDKLKEIWATGKILDGNSSGRFFRDNITGREQIDGLNTMYKVYGIGDDMLPYRYFTGPKRAGATKGKYFQGVPKDKLHINETQVRTLPIVNFYNFADSFGNCRHEGGIDFRNGKKPLRFLRTFLDLILVDDDEIVLDFFAGSGSTGHAVWQYNLDKGSQNNFILVQLQEDVAVGDYKNIAELTKQRLKNASHELTSNNNEGRSDLGFRVFKLDRSNLSIANSGQSVQASRAVALFDNQQPMLDGWQVETVIPELMLLDGYPLDSRVEQSAIFSCNTVYSVKHPEQDNQILICLDEEIQRETILRAGDYTKTTFICLDSALTDEAKLQLDDKITLKTL